MRSFLLLIASFFMLPLMAEQYVYVSSSGTSTLEIYDFDKGVLSLKDKFQLKGAPGNSVISPDKKYIYVSVRTGKGKNRKSNIETLEILADGKVKSVGIAETPQYCGFLDIDKTGTYLFASHYGEGKVSSYKLEKGIYKGKVLQDLKTDDRAHSVGIDDAGMVYVPHTLPNKVYQFKFENEKLVPLSPASADGPDKDNNYHEPRHFAFHPSKNLLYTSNERGGGISLWSRSATGQLTLKQTVNTLPDNANERFAASDITISKDGRFVFIAERDNLDRKNPKGNDCITVYSLNESTGALEKKVGTFGVGRHPRCLRLDTTNKYLFGPGVHSSTLTVYKLDQKTGALSEIKTYQTGKAPMWVLALEK